MDFRNPAHTPAKPAEPAAPAVSTKHRRSAGIKKPTVRSLMWALIVVLLAAAVGTAAYYINRYNDSQNQLKKLSSNPTVTAQQEQQQLISKVGKLTVLPKDETPTVATVTDISKLKDQAFFTNAQNGDKVLIYTNAKKAFLYRPGTGKLINIAPLNVGNGSSSTGTSSTTNTNSTTKKP